MAIIVTNGRPKESQVIAAAELQEHIRIMSGATLPIIKETELQSNPSKTFILVGPGNYCFYISRCQQFDDVMAGDRTVDHCDTFGTILVSSNHIVDWQIRRRRMKDARKECH